MRKTIALIVVTAIVLIGGGLGGAYYVAEAANSIKTDDAMVQGTLVNIAPAAQGRLSAWNVKPGEKVTEGEVVGTVETRGADGQPASVDILAPIAGTVLQDNAVVNQLVGAGTPLAMVSDLGRLFVTANIAETDLQDVKTGQKVDIKVDAFPGVVFHGTVSRIGLATESTFSLLPAGNASGNYTKVVQRVPVTITLDNLLGNDLIPGLNATVKIEK